MMKPIHNPSVEVIPQAVINLPIEKVVKEHIIKGSDDLDVFKGASFKLDDEIELSVRHYAGHPEGTATIYIDGRVREVERITALIRRILKELNVPADALFWERKDDPDL